MLGGRNWTGSAGERSPAGCCQSDAIGQGLGQTVDRLENSSKMEGNSKEGQLVGREEVKE